MDNATATVVHRDEAEEREKLPVHVEEAHAFDLASIENPTAAIEVAERLVTKMASKCSGPQYIAPIAGRKYPKVEWWTTVGASLGLFPREESNVLLDREDEIAYEATVAVYRGDMVVTRASAICSSKERQWSNRDEYAVRSMAATRATGKAFRLGLSFIATLAGLEPTPAEEIPSDGFDDDKPFDLDGKVGFGKHSDLTWRELAIDEPGYIRWHVEQKSGRITPTMLTELRNVVKNGGKAGDEDPGDDEYLEGGTLDLDEPAELSIAQMEVRAEIGVKDREAIFERLGIEKAADDPDGYAAELQGIIDAKEGA